MPEISYNFSLSLWIKPTMTPDEFPTPCEGQRKIGSGKKTDRQQ